MEDISAFNLKSSSEKVSESGTLSQICDPGAQNQSQNQSKSQSYWGIFVANIVWVKMINFSFMPKIIRILRKDRVLLKYFVNFLF